MANLESVFELAIAEAERAGAKAALKCQEEGEEQMMQIPGYDPFPVCGFAWVNVSPGNSKFANFLKRKGLADRDSGYGGVSTWVSKFGQSHSLKRAYARAYADSLNESLVLSQVCPNLKIIAMDRLD